MASSVGNDFQGMLILTCNSALSTGYNGAATKGYSFLAIGCNGWLGLWRELILCF